MTIKKFLLISVMIHAIIFIGLYFLPQQKTEKTKEFFTQLVTPEQANVPEIQPQPVNPIPVKPAAKPLPIIPRPFKSLPPASRYPSKPIPSKDRPIVPGQGKDDGKPLPEGRSLRPDSAVTSGDGTSEEISSKPGYIERGKQPGKRETTTGDKFFDRGIIEATALRGDGAKKKDDTITFDTKDYRYAGYMRKLKEKIESIWEYPPQAIKENKYGDLRISFTIRKDGKLGAVELVRTSGYKMLDDAALKALKDGEPYWPIPDDWGMDSYTINGHFFYTMYGYGVR